MSNLLEQYQGHQLYQTLSNKLEEIANALNNDTYNETQKESLLAYQQILVLIQANLNTRTLPIVPNRILNDLNAAIQNLHISYLIDMNNNYPYYQQLMNSYRMLFTIEKKSEVKESLNQILENFTNKQNKISETIDSEIDNFKTCREEQLNSWEQEKEAMQSEIEQLKQDKIELDNEVKLLSEKISEQESRINDLMSKFKDDYEANRDDFEERFVEQEKEHNTKVENLLSDQKNAADATLDHLEQRKEEVEKLWGIIGKSATVGNASSKATEHKKFADTMMWWTIVLMCIALVIIGIATWKLFSGTYTYMSFVWKVLTSAIILVPAFYCANISKRQRDREFQLRDFEIKIATLEPFMENMILDNDYDNDAPINKDKVKLELTKIFFDKQFSNSNNANDCIFIPKELAKILKEFAKNGGKVNIGVNDTDE